jgi:hypothetical protein
MGSREKVLILMNNIYLDSIIIRLFYFVRGDFIASNNLASYILHSFHAE